MTKKKNQKLHASKASTKNNVPHAEAAVPFRLEDIRKQARDAIDKEDWAAIAQLGRYPLTGFQECDHPEAISWLPRARILGLLENGHLSIYGLSPEINLEVRDALKTLASINENFYSHVEFNLYLKVFRHDWNHTDYIIKNLIAACTNVPNAMWLCELRQTLLWVDSHAHADIASDADIIPARDVVAAQYQTPRALLQDVYETVEQGAQIDTFAQNFLKVFLLEEQLVAADPWDIQRIAARIREISSPNASELIKSQGDYAGVRQRMQLTPDAWAFLAELSVTSVQHFNGLLDKYPAQFGCMPCDVLRKIATCIATPNEEADLVFSDAVEALFAEDEVWPWFFGESLAIQVANGIEELHVGPLNLHLANNFSSYLLHFYEEVSSDHRYSSQLGALYRVFEMRGKGETLEPDSDMQGFFWLCERSLMFQIVCSNLLPRFGQRMAMLVTALARSGEELKNIPEDFFRWVYSEKDELRPEDETISLEDEEEVTEPNENRLCYRSYTYWIQKGAVYKGDVPQNQIDSYARLRIEIEKTMAWFADKK